jgi:hypothetical protein
MPLSQTQLDQFHRDGYIIVPDVYTADEMDAACEATERIFYQKPYAEWLNAFDAGQADQVGDGFTTKQDEVPARSQFPVGDQALDRLIENDDYLDIFEQCLGDNASYCNAHLFMRTGPTDKRYPDESWSGYHIDHNTNCILPPSTDADHFSYVNSAAYLHDVEDDGAPMLVIPGSHRQASDAFVKAYATDNMTSPGQVRDLRKADEFAAPVPSTASKGSALFYSSYLLHSAQPFQNARKQRAFWTLSMARRDAAAWTKFANPFIYGEREFMLPFMAETTPRVRTLFGWPEVGHPYYTEQTLGLLEKSLASMDTSPYKRAIKK